MNLDVNIEASNESWKLFIISDNVQLLLAFSKIGFIDELNNYSTEVFKYNSPIQFLENKFTQSKKGIVYLDVSNMTSYAIKELFSTDRFRHIIKKIYLVMIGNEISGELQANLLINEDIDDYRSLNDFSDINIKHTVYSNIKTQQHIIELSDLKEHLEDRIKDANEEIRRAFKSSGKQHIKLQKLLYENELQRGKLEEALEEIKSKNEALKLQNDQILLQRDHIEQQKEEIHSQMKIAVEQRDQILFQQQQINDNIKYARRIQHALLPPEEFISQLLPAHFVYNRPKDIVSGDFYWISQNRSKTVVAVADCTGHGISGAMMSMLGTAFLNEIVNKDDVTTASDILMSLRDKVILSLHQNHDDSIYNLRDGMDISVCIIDIVDSTLEYSGANNPVYIFREEEFIELKPNRMPIGIHDFDKEPFTSVKVQVKENDFVYMFTDGFVDQFGGKKSQKLKYRRFKELLRNLGTLPVEKRKNKLDSFFHSWKGDNEQIDDILVLGFEIQ